MTKKQLSIAVAFAQSGEQLETFVGEGSFQRLIDTFNCFGMKDFEPVCITIRDLAALIRHECCEFGGEICNESLNEIARHGRRNFIVLGLGDESLENIELPHWYAAMVHA